MKSIHRILSNTNTLGIYNIKKLTGAVNRPYEYSMTLVSSHTTSSNLNHTTSSQLCRYYSSTMRPKVFLTRPDYPQIALDLLNKE